MICPVVWLAARGVVERARVSVRVRKVGPGVPTGWEKGDGVGARTLGWWRIMSHKRRHKVRAVEGEVKASEREERRKGYRWR